jgi:hypothetical protein
VNRALEIDTSVGGFGDVWMRLHGFYALAALRWPLKIVARVAPALADVASTVFGARLELTTHELPNAISFTHLGVRDLAAPILRGRRFVNPFHRTNTANGGWAEQLNRAAFATLATTGRVYLNDDALTEFYAGWMQISALPAARGVAAADVEGQLRHDFAELRGNLRALISEKRGEGVVIFPSGSSFQLMPPSIAADVLPDALYAFHDRDRYQETFAQAGLRVEAYANVVGLVRLASGAKLTICTDSFPSHVLQTYSRRTVAALSHYPRRRIVHPAFDGTVLDSAASCCPCVTRARTPGGSCPAGKSFCATWDDAGYRMRLGELTGSAARLSARR